MWPCRAQRVIAGVSIGEAMALRARFSPGFFPSLDVPGAVVVKPSLTIMSLIFREKLVAAAEPTSFHSFVYLSSQKILDDR